MLGSEVRGEVGEGKCQSREQKPWKIKSYEFLYYFRYVSWHLSRKSPNGMTLQIMTESDVIWPKWCPVWSASTSGVHSGINGGGHFTLADLTAYTCGPGVSLAKSAFPWRWEGDPGACPPGNIFNQEINLVQSILSRAQKKDVLTRLLEIPTFSFHGTNVSLSETWLHFYLKSAKSLRTDTPDGPKAAVYTWGHTIEWRGTSLLKHATHRLHNITGSIGFSREIKSNAWDNPHTYIHTLLGKKQAVLACLMKRNKKCLNKPTHRPTSIHRLPLTRMYWLVSWNETKCLKPTHKIHTLLGKKQAVLACLMKRNKKCLNLKHT